MRVLVERGGCAPGGWEAGKRVSLDENEVHHLQVRRAKGGELVEILDGGGLRGSGLLVQAGRHWYVDVQSAEREPRPPELTLAVAAGDRDRFSWMVEKAVELGVTCVVPLQTARTTGVATGIRETHLHRLRRHALEATKQCGATWALELAEPLSLDDFLARRLAGMGWMADRTGSLPPSYLGATPLTVVIGPEGGLTDAERSRVAAAGYQPTVVGPHTLRFETAAVAAAAVATTARMRGGDG